MGITTKSVPFFVDTITIKPHTCTDAKHLDKVVSIRQFANGKPVSLEIIQETGEMLVRGCNGSFMQGPEV